jgi:hypothetical protein
VAALGRQGAFEDPVALVEPAGRVDGQLRERLGRQLWRAWRRWLHPTSGRRPDDTLLDTLV